MKEAMFYEKLNGEVKCVLCPHNCRIKEEKRGICGVRENKNGKLYSLVYGKAIARHIDPIEKKPFFNFYPGSTAYSIGTIGCNFRCKHCQNWDISQAPRDQRESEYFGESFYPEEIVRTAIDYGCESVSYTYNEPTIFFEYAYDTSRIAKEKGLKNNFVTNGYMTKEALNMIKPYLDAANVDLKAFSDKFYREVCGARLDPVLESIKHMKKIGIWIEVTTLIIPTLNDSEDELREIAAFLREVGPEIPWHITRYHPAYKLTLPPTPVETIHRAREIGIEEGLRYVYTGNIPGDPGENTYCYNCGEMIIQRHGFGTVKNKVKNSRCPYCGTTIDGRGI
ncbi:MAG: AmmeMemoRadiSam system radical SAM enzyme [Candidatus Syntropharchaeia archaeon]